MTGFFTPAEVPLTSGVLSRFCGVDFGGVAFGGDGALILGSRAWTDRGVGGGAPTIGGGALASVGRALALEGGAAALDSEGSLVPKLNSEGASTPDGKGLLALDGKGLLELDSKGVLALEGEGVSVLDSELESLKALTLFLSEGLVL